MKNAYIPITATTVIAMQKHQINLSTPDVIISHIITCALSFFGIFKAQLEMDVLFKKNMSLATLQKKPAVIWFCAEQK